MNFNILLLCSGIVGAIFLMLPLKELKSGYFAIATAALGVIVVANTLRAATPLFTYYRAFFDSEMSAYFKLLFKVLGITLVCNITSELASDMGMNSLSGKVELAGKLAVILSSLPMLDSLLNEIQALI